MEVYKFSKSSPYDFRRSLVTAGPSGMQIVHPQMQAIFDQESASVYTLRDHEIEVSWQGRMRGGAGSNGAAGEADGAAGGGGGGAAGDPPPPPHPPLSDHGRPGGRCTSRRQR